MRSSPPCSGQAIVRIHDPIRLNSFSQPQPDVALVRPRTDFYRSAHPQPAEVLLVVEISDTTLRYDRLVKTPLYARNGIAEYWLVDLRARTVTCHALPGDEGYGRETTHVAGETLSPGALPECRVRVDDLL